MNSESFCILPWIHARVGQDGEVNPCCRNYDYRYGSMKDNTLSEIWNGKSLEDFRQAFLKGEKPASCKECWHHEAIGIPSYRQNANAQFSTTPNKSDGILFLDLRFSNVCNLRCRICNPYNSTAWYQDQRILEPQSEVPHEKISWLNSKNQEDLKSLIPGLNCVYFAGGEPLLQEEHYWFLEELIRQKKTDVSLIYNSNFSSLNFKNWNVLDYWKHFKEVHVSASLDGVGAHAEYMRKGQSWLKVEQNFKQLLVFAPQVRFHVFPTVSILNVFQLPEIFEEFIQLGMVRRPGHIQLNFLSEPEYLGLQILDQGERELLKSRLLSFSTRGNPWLNAELSLHIEGLFKQVLNWVDAHPTNFQARKKFSEKTIVIDQLRSENILQFCPELAGLFTDQFKEKRRGAILPPVVP